MRTAFWGAVLLIFAFATTEANAVDSKRVLLLHSFGRDFAPWSESARNFHAEIAKESPEPIDIFEASLLEEDAWLVEYIKSLSSGRRLDLVVSIGPPAAHFVQAHRKALFIDTPQLILAAEERAISTLMLTADDAVVGTRLDPSIFIDNILLLLPDVDNIAVVIGNSPLEQFWIQVLRREYQHFDSRVKITYLNDLPLEEMVTRIADLEPHSAIFYAMLIVDAEGVPQALDRALAPILAAAKVPVFGLTDYHLGQGVVGGPLMPVRGESQRAAGVALRILRGEVPGDIEVPLLEHAAPTYDWRELQRWGISEARLPPGSILQFREPTAWEKYHWQISLIALALLLQASMIFTLLAERRRRRSAERESHRRMLEVMHLNRMATAGEMSASIAHEINQPLAAIVSSGNAGLRWLSNNTPDLDEVAASLKRIVSDGHRASNIIETIRTMFRKGASERVLVDLNELIREVLALSNSEIKDHNISVSSILMEGLPRVLGDRTQLEQVILNLVRNAVEAMSSITSRARMLRIRSETNDAGEVLISIEDSGPGIEPNNLDHLFEPFFTTKSKGMGMGLSICRSIIEDHGGTLTAAAGKSEGAVFQVLIPVPR